MTDLANKTELIEYLKSHGLYTKHSLGQNFLVDRDALNKITEAAEIIRHPASPSQGEELVVEVGSGLGTLTRELTTKAQKVIAIELDEKLAELLVQLFDCSIARLLKNNETMKQWSNDTLTVLNADILKVNIPELVGDRPYKVVANIPYYITSKIIQLFLTLPNKPELLVMLVQKEVAERICARPRLDDRRGKPGEPRPKGRGEMSVLSISVQAYGEPEIVGIVPKESFFPAPKVDSAILRIRIQNTELRIQPEQEKEFFRLVHIGFASRRKTLENNLVSGLHIDKTTARDIIKAAGFAENIRAQELGVDDWKKLTSKLNNES